MSTKKTGVEAHTSGEDLKKGLEEHHINEATEDTDKTMNIKLPHTKPPRNLDIMPPTAPHPLSPRHQVPCPYHAFLTPFSRPLQTCLRLTAPTGRLLDTLACTNLDSWLVVGCWGSHSFLIQILAEWKLLYVGNVSL